MKSSEAKPQEGFRPITLGPPWDYYVSPRSDCRFDPEQRVLHLNGPANCHAFVECRPNAGSCCGLSAEVLCGYDAANAWGVGIALCWPGRQFLRVNVRADRRYGIDDGRRSILSGTTPAQGWTTLRLRLTPLEVLAEAATEFGLWADLAAFPREVYPGDPCVARLGKMSRWGTAKDFHNPGPMGRSAIRNMVFLVPGT